MLARAAVVLALLLSAGVYGSTAGSAETIVPRQSLSEMPLARGEWRGREASPFADDVLAQLGVDDYINRQYQQPGSAPIGIYVGYYDSQRQGDTIHSPQNCLPGSGWRPIETRIARLPVAGREVPVNQFVIQKGIDRQVVFYWYQGRGRVIANEYANKALLMLDAARMHRTNGGLVRLITPVVTTPEAATRELTAFATLAFPLLDAHLP
jgi:EpsI family protein